MTPTVNLKRFRNKYKLTQEKAAKSIGIDQRQWNRYENGHNDIPVRYLKSICLNNTVSADWLLEIHDKEALDIKKELEKFRDKIFFDVLDYAIGNNYIDQITADEILKPMIDSTLEDCIKEMIQSNLLCSISRSSRIQKDERSHQAKESSFYKILEKKCIQEKNIKKYSSRS